MSLINKNILIENMVIEVTRDCNANCGHCLRGDSNKLDITPEHIHSFFDGIKGGIITYLTISGGEPSLKPHLIREITSALVKNEITVDQILIVTNGLITSYLTDEKEKKQEESRFTEFIESLKVMKTSLIDNGLETLKIEISNDNFHPVLKGPDLKRWESITMNHSYDDSYPEVLLRHKTNSEILIDNYFVKDIRKDYLLKEGHLKDEDNNPNLVLKDNNPAFMEMQDYDDDLLALNEYEIYLNAKGDVLLGCDYSYKTQDDKFSIRAENVSKESLFKLSYLTNNLNFGASEKKVLKEQYEFLKTHDLLKTQDDLTDFIKEKNKSKDLISIVKDFVNDCDVLPFGKDEKSINDFIKE